MRKLLLVLFMGLSLAGSAVADTSADKGPGDKKKPVVKAKAKAGEACKVEADCDQSGLKQMCVDKICQHVEVPPPVT
jgi:hypothetical protein